MRPSERLAITRLEQTRLALAGVPIRADDVYDPLRRQLPCNRPPGLAHAEPVGKPTDAVGQDLWATDAVNRTVYPATAAHPGVCGVDDHIGALGGDVAFYQPDPSRH
jgi:hypothetical protein